MRKLPVRVGVLLLGSAPALFVWACGDRDGESTDGSVVHDGGTVVVTEGGTRSSDASNDATDALPPIVRPDDIDPTPLVDPQPPVPKDAGPNVTTGELLLNEISAHDEWIEVVNIGAAPTSIAGYALVDGDKSTGEPKPKDAFTFPAGATIAAGGYVVVRDLSFGISRKEGDVLYLIAPGGAIVGRVAMPPNATSSITTWSRLPSGDAAAPFAAAAPTPGAPNVE